MAAVCLWTALVICSFFSFVFCESASAYKHFDDLTIVTELSAYSTSRNNSVTDNAIKSWLLNTNFVLVLVQNRSVCNDIIGKFPSVKCEEHRCKDQTNIPFLSCLMITGETVAATNYLLFTQGYISFGPLFSRLATVVENVPNFVLMGKRINVPKKYLEAEGDDERRIDYLIYPKQLALSLHMSSLIVGNGKSQSRLFYDFIASNRAIVIDTTNDIRAVNAAATPISSSKTARNINKSKIYDRATEGIYEIGMGSFRYADAIMENGQIIRKTDISTAVAKFIYTKAMKSDSLLVVTVPCGFLENFKNWYAWVQKSGIESFILFPMDVATANYAKEHNLNVPPLAYDLLDASKSKCHDLTHLETSLVHRNYFLRNISQAGIGFASLSVNTIILEAFRFSSDLNMKLFGQKLSGNAFLTDISDGMWGVSSAFSRSGVKLLTDVITCQEQRLKNILRDHDSNLQYFQLKPHGVNNIATDCLNGEVKKNFVEFLTILPQSIVASGHSVFELHSPQRKGIYPCVIHQDIVCGPEESLSFLNEWNFVLSTEQFNRNMPHSSLGSAFIHNAYTNGQAGLVIRILTMNRPDQLATLFKSLIAADYGKDRVDMEIHIDYPTKATNHTLHLYSVVKEAVNSFQWPYGDKRIVDPGVPRGLFNMWVQPFEPKHAGQALLVLEDDTELSPVFYQWVKSILAHLNGHNDPRLFGFSLQRQHSVIGLRADQKYSTTFIDLQMDPSQLFYRYQLLSSWGTVLFPGHWNTFVKWAKEVRSSSPDFKPCVPFFFNNIWYLKNPSHIWTIWFNYYIYMHGLYSLYINYARFDTDGRYFSLLKNHRATGLHFKAKPKSAHHKLDMQDKLEFILAPPSPNIPVPTAMYPLYDFHLQSVSKAELLSDRWRFMSNIKDKCQVNHPHMLGK